MWKQISPWCIQDGPYFIAKAYIPDATVYTATKGNERIATERGEGALDRCKQAVEEDKKR